jgi:hypothetical protein
MGMKRILFAVLVAVVGFCSPSPVAAQTPTQEQRQRALNELQEMIPTADETREELRAIMKQYPYTVPEILRRDPSLMGRADYMASYPKLVEFLAQHPEIARNVEYYFEGYGSRGEPRQRLDPSFEALGVLLGGLGVGFILILFSCVIIWLVRAFIQHRRWLKASQVQADVHSKLMERMTSNEELLAYIQSPTGRRFLDAAPVRPETDSPSFSAPVGSIIWSLMAGVVLSVLGIGFRYAGTLVKEEDAHAAFMVVGVIILSLGIGFIVASLMAFAVSSRLGLFPQKRVAQESQSGNA